MPVPDLPPELMDEIIAWIPPFSFRPFGYYSTLLRCCLVCSQWLSASRRQLFQHVYLRFTHHYALFVSRVLLQGSMEVHLAQVRTLELANTASMWGKSYKRGSIPFPYAFAGHLPNLTSLTFSDGGLMAFLSRHPCTPLALSQFSSIRELRITSDQFPSFEHVRRTLTSLLNLTVLVMHSDVSWPEPAAELSPPIRHDASPSPRPMLLALSYICRNTFNERDRRRAHRFLTWLASTSTGSSLRRLTLRSFSVETDIYGDLCGPGFLHTAARCVEQLTLGIRCDIGESVR